jgi:hypothetical protein
MRACSLARDYQRRGNASPWQLLQESGYLEKRTAIDVATMRGYFLAHPEGVGEWLLYSDNKRVSSGWYFSEADSAAAYVVGYFPTDPKRPDRRFTEAAEACATFVKSELEQMAGG